MQISPDNEETPDGDGHRFPPFDLARLVRTVFDLQGDESVGIFTDLPEPRRVEGFAYLEEPGLVAQAHAFHTLYQGLRERRGELGLREVRFYSYQETGGSNLDLPEEVWTPEGRRLPLRETLRRHSIVLFMGTWSATAPVTALAKEMGFRGATMHGANDTVVATGLAVDYRQVSARAERLRRALTRADSMRLEWSLGERRVAMEVELGRQEAQKSHGLVRSPGEIANLPAGEVYWVPEGAEGVLPQVLDDGSIALFAVRRRGIVAVEELVRGGPQAAAACLAVVREDPNAGQITELGLGTQSLPFAGTDIQDEKILGTAHLATGRSDHLGGDISSADFRDRRHATHNDILWTPRKTPEIELTRVTMRKDGRQETILERYRPTPFLERFL